MSGAAVAAIWMTFFIAIGTAVAITVVARSRVAQARAGADLAHEYREIAAQAVAAQQQQASEIAQLSQRLGSLETLLREVA